MDWDQILKPHVIAIVMGCSVAIVAIIAHYWHQIAKAQSENDLKRSMVERGMSADEIERVLRARPAGGSHGLPERGPSV